MKTIDQLRFDSIVKELSGSGPILVVGDVGLDKYTHGQVRKISPEAPVPVLEVKGEWEKLGMAANISDNLASLEVENSLCGVIGEDKHAESLKDVLKLLAKGKDCLVSSADRPTTYKERIVAGGQQICRIDYEKTDLLDEKDESNFNNKILQLVPQHKAVIIEDYSKGCLNKNTIQSTIAAAKSEGIQVFVDPGRQTPPHYYRGASLLKPNRDEAVRMVELLGKSKPKMTIEECSEVLLEELDLQQIVITLGAEGMFMVDKEGKHCQIPTLAQEVFDVSGAGDTTIALLAASQVAGASLEEAAWMANFGAGVVVAKKGTATASLNEICAFYHRVTSS